jgi:transposase
MEVLYPRCAGLDVHAGSVTACARIATDAQVTYDHHTVPTTTRGLLALAEWIGPPGGDTFPAFSQFVQRTPCPAASSL